MLVVSLTGGEGAAACGTVTEFLDTHVVSAPDGATLLLSNGDKVRLSGIQAPKLSFFEDANTDWPMAEAAKARLDGLAAGSRIALDQGRNLRDRHGRLIGQVYLPDGTWLQMAMVAGGYARAYSFPDTRGCAAELVQAEARARAERLGIWAEPFYAIRDAARPADLLARAGSFDLVEGRVLTAEKVGAMVYLNFGRYWKEDFTVTIDKTALKLFAADGHDPLRLEGALVRVRGWIEDLDGPRIVVTHPEQIEVLATP
jgi:endonuclease YncB( thermonuclease family)